MAMAMKCDEKFVCTGNGVSKNDIKELSKRLKQYSFNGRSFNIEAVQKLFKKGAALENPETSDYGPYWKNRHQFSDDYGNTAEAEILFDLAKADFYIKKYEKEHGLKISDNAQVVTDYIFLGTGRKEYQERLVTSDCIMDAKIGEADTKCKHDPGSSGLLGSILYIATAGNLGDPNSAQRENTTCVTEKPVHALVLSKVGDEEVVYAASFMARGRATEFDKNIWFRHGLKVTSKKKCDQEALEIEDQAVLYSCNKHRPLGTSDNNEFNRSPAVVEQFGKKLKLLQSQQ